MMDVELLIEAVRNSGVAEVWYEYKFGAEVAAEARSELPSQSETLLPTPELPALVQ